jgi:uncharacterized protein YjbI with pentapeptide repeats
LEQKCASIIDLSKADLSGTNLRGAALRGANLDGLDLMAAKVTMEQLLEAKSLMDQYTPIVLLCGMGFV